MANENELMNSTEEFGKTESLNFDELEEKLQSQLDEELTDLDFLKEEKDKIGKPDNLGNIIKDVVWEQFIKDEYRAVRADSERELEYLKSELEKNSQSATVSGNCIDTEHIRKTLDEILSVDNGHISDEIIGKFVSRITPLDNTNFEWIINLGEEKSEKIRCTLTGRKNSAELTIGDGQICHFTYWLINLLDLYGKIFIKAHAGEMLAQAAIAEK